jgi:TetR/AcrR family transcriptional regulator, cholesterol catabolism regulator
MSKEEILLASAQIISQKGFHATSMQDIAEAVHLQKASLYHHFSCKQEILLLLLDQALDLVTDRVASVMAQDLSADEKLRQAVCTYLETMADHAALAVVLLFEHRSLEPEYQKRHFPRRDRFEKLWLDLINEGVQTGIFQNSSPAMAARAMFGTMNWTMTWYRPDGALSMSQICDRISALFMDGLRGKE